MAIISQINTSGSTFTLAIPYGTCSVAVGTAAKTATISGVTLSEGTQVRVKFTNGNSAATPTLNINSTGAKSIVTTNAGGGESIAWAAGAVIDFTYNGTAWVMDNVGAFKAGTCTVAGGGLSKGDPSGGGLSGGGLSGGGLSNSGTVTPVVDIYETASASQDNTVTLDKVDVGDKNATDYPYYFKVTADTTATSAYASRAGVTRGQIDRAAFSQTVTRANITDAHTAGYIPDKAATTVISTATETVSLGAGSMAATIGLTAATTTISIAQGTKTEYVKLKKGALGASSSQSSAGSANVSTNMTPVSSSSFTISLSTTAGSAKGSASVSSEGWVKNETGSQSGTTSIAVNPNTTTIYIKEASATATAGGATATASIAKQPSASASINPGSASASISSSGIVTTTSTTSYYVSAAATATAGSASASAASGYSVAAATATGGSASVGEGYTTGKSASGAGANKSASSVEVSASTTSSASTVSKSTVVYIPAADCSHSGNGLSQGTASGGTLSGGAISGGTLAGGGLSGGGLSGGGAGASASGNVTLTEKTSQPTSGYYITVKGSAAAVTMATVTRAAVTRSTITRAAVERAAFSQTVTRATLTCTHTAGYMPAGSHYMNSTSSTVELAKGTLTAGYSNQTQLDPGYINSSSVSASTATKYYQLPTGTCAHSGNGLSKGTASGGGLEGGALGRSTSTVTPTVDIYEVDSSAQDANVTLTSVDIGAKDTTNYPYYFKVGANSSASTVYASRAKVKRNAFSQAVTRATLTCSHTEGYIPTGTDYMNSTSSTVELAADDGVTIGAATTSIGIASGSTTEYVKLKKGGLSAGVSITDGGATVATSMSVSATSTAYNITLTPSNGSVTGTASVATEGYVKNETASSGAKAVTVTPNTTTIYITKAVNSGKVSTHTVTTPSVAVTKAAGGFTASSATTSYYVSVTKGAVTGGVSTATAKGSITTAGYIGTGDSAESAASTVSIGADMTGGGYVFIPTTGVTASIATLSVPSVAVAGTAGGFTASSATTAYYVKVTGTKTDGSVKGKAKGNGTGMITASTENTSAATAITPTITGNNGYVFIPAGNFGVNSPTINVGTVSVQTTPGNISILKNTASVSGKTRIDVEPVTTPSSISTYYLAIRATAAANSTGSTKAISGTATTAATISTAGYLAANTNKTGTATASGTAKATTSGKNSDIYYLPIPSGTITNNTSGGTSSGTINAGSQIKIGAGYYGSDTYYQAASSPTLSGNAVVGDVLAGKTFYNSSYTKQTGTMVNRGTYTATIAAGSSVALSGYYAPGSYVAAESSPTVSGWIKCHVSGSITWGIYTRDPSQDTGSSWAPYAWAWNSGSKVTDGSNTYDTVCTGSATPSPGDSIYDTNGSSLDYQYTTITVKEYHDGAPGDDWSEWTTLSGSQIELQMGYLYARIPSDMGGGRSNDLFYAKVTTEDSARGWSLFYGGITNPDSTTWATQNAWHYMTGWINSLSESSPAEIAFTGSFDGVTNGIQICTYIFGPSSATQSDLNASGVKKVNIYPSNASGLGFILQIYEDSSGVHYRTKGIS